MTGKMKMVVEITAQKEGGGDKSGDHTAGMKHFSLLLNKVPAAHNKESTESIEGGIDSWKLSERHC